WHTAWSEYNSQFEPDNTIGFAAKVPRPIPPGLDQRKAHRARTIAEEKVHFTWQESLRRAVADPNRVCQMIFPAVGFYGLVAFAPFGWWHKRSTDSRSQLAWLLVGGIVLHYAAYSFFYSTWHIYG